MFPIRRIGVPPLSRPSYGSNGSYCCLHPLVAPHVTPHLTPRDCSRVRDVPQVTDDYLAKMQDCLGVIRSVNKSDVLTLASNLGSLKAVCNATPGDLSWCPGLGDKKVSRIHEALHVPLSSTVRSRREREGQHHS